ncbi:Inner nuclear membrane protein SRC1 [Tolypocladium ophioglossoides CBS 100239]|uniref:Inner nuclear membrane protein SRC1 n=1 Tax=Tolypocladium ophioglossoides (strain CBS 100239) TaxID=1163406 RepID=A0A0L0NMT8_TOLOC|nr:Inner nuclear membrane protein SRC1 [Tolypocladium ophioglossoides CBS 100239]
MADVDDYLQEGFDPRSVTVPRLRSILVTHNVDYPSTAKKPQLVQLVADHVLSQAPKLRAQRARAKRSSYGIVNAWSAEDTNTWDDHELPPPRSAPRRSGSPRKSSAKVKVEEDEAESSHLRSPRKRTSKSANRQLYHVDDDTISEVSRSTRRSRRTITPQIKPESDEDEEQAEELEPPQEDDNVFTDDNPFQSGSPPPAAKTPTQRRRTGGEELFKSATSRRRTDGVAERAKTSRSFEVPASRLRSKTPEAGEEFTPNEQLELEEAASKGELPIITQQAPSKASRQTSLKTPLFVLLFALLSAYGAWYRQEKIAVGYCGLGRPAKELLPAELPVPDSLVPFVEPQCEQCPQHAFCYRDFTVRCHQDFVLKPHPLSLGGLVPLPPTCEPDGEKARRVQAVADKAIEELRERRAKFECGDLVDEDGQQRDSPAIAEQELKESVSKKRNKRLNSQEFDELWAAAIGEVTAREEVVVEVEKTETSDSSHLPARKLSSTSLARLSLVCAAKRSLRLGLARYRLPVGLLISVVLAIFYLRARYRRHLATSAQIPALVELVLGRLANQKELGEEDLDDPWLFLPNLRDDILRSVHSLSERERIWQRVRAVVELNSNVRTGQREGRSGEVGRAWEWIGAVKGEGARRRLGRVSWAPEVKSESPESREMTETRKWEEARPFY